jgi:hypothetical protein
MVFTWSLKLSFTFLILISIFQILLSGATLGLHSKVRFGMVIKCTFWGNKDSDCICKNSFRERVYLKVKDVKVSSITMIPYESHKVCLGILAALPDGSGDGPVLP